MLETVSNSWEEALNETRSHSKASIVGVFYEEAEATTQIHHIGRVIPITLNDQPGILYCNHFTERDYYRKRLLETEQQNHTPA